MNALILMLLLANMTCGQPRDSRRRATGQPLDIVPLERSAPSHSRRTFAAADRRVISRSCICRSMTPRWRSSRTHQPYLVEASVAGLRPGCGGVGAHRVVVALSETAASISISSCVLLGRHAVTIRARQALRWADSLPAAARSEERHDLANIGQYLYKKNHDHGADAAFVWERAAAGMGHVKLLAIGKGTVLPGHTAGDDERRVCRCHHEVKSSAEGTARDRTEEQRRSHLGRRRRHRHAARPLEQDRAEFIARPQQHAAENAPVRPSQHQPG